MIALYTERRTAGKSVGVSEPFWVPLPPQVNFLEVNAKRKLLGGAAGGTKSNTAIRGAVRLAMMYPRLSILVVRKSFPELERTHIRTLRRDADTLGYTWHEKPPEARFTNGSVIECGHLDDADAVQKYLSSEYDLIVCEEGVQFDPDGQFELWSRARTSNEAVKTAGGPWVWVVTNPGGPSHHLLKSLFILKTPDTERYPALARTYRPEEWAYIPTTLDDNPYLDTDYERLSLSGLRATRYAQLRQGDWDAVEGAFFEEWGPQHKRTVVPPDGARWVEALDWGYIQPGCAGWYVQLSDAHWHKVQDWKFKLMTPAEVAKGMLERRAEIAQRYALGRTIPVSYTVFDTAMDNQQGGETQAETFRRPPYSFRMRPASKIRARDAESGWARVHSWLRLAPDGVPWLTVDPDWCPYTCRTIPSLTADAHNPEDVDTTQDDHAADETRYFVMSRPPLTIERPREAAVESAATHGAWRRYFQRREQQPRWA